MSDILHDTLHVWHIDLSYSYKQKNTRFCVAFTYFHIFSCILAAFSILRFCDISPLIFICFATAPHSPLAAWFSSFRHNMIGAVFKCFFSLPRF